MLYVVCAVANVSDVYSLYLMYSIYVNANALWIRLWMDFDTFLNRAKMGASIVDALDTMIIMGLNAEARTARTWITTNLSFNHVCSYECNI